MPGNPSARTASSPRQTQLPAAAELVTPSDTAVFDGACMVMAVTAGDIAAVPVYPKESDPIPLTLEAGQFVPFQCMQVYATGTTATEILAVW